MGRISPPTDVGFLQGEKESTCVFVEVGEEGWKFPKRYGRISSRLVSKKLVIAHAVYYIHPWYTN
jgi:hypothetical protein